MKTPKILLMLLMLLLCSSVSAFATPSVSLPDVNADAGASVEIPINANLDMAIFGFQFNITYDSSVLNCTNAVQGDLPQGMWFLENNFLVSGNNTIIGLDFGGLGAGPGIGTLAVLQCTAVGSPGANTALSFAFAEVGDELANPITPTTDPGMFTINGGGPSTETECFDDIDNDSDGQTDCADSDCSSATDGACTTGQPGICSDGTWICSGGSKVCDANNDPQTEGPFGNASCSDGQDNDCDGSTDTGDSDCEEQCTPTGNPDSNCDGVDDDCDGTADDEYMPTDTTCGVGACASTGQTTCQNGSEADTCTAGTPGTEGPFGDSTCSDQVDNDCDGTTDSVDAGCAEQCTPTGNPDTNCDGVDDDCDGTVDDEYVSSSCSTGLPGICAIGTLICSNGSEVCQNNQAQTEGPFGDTTCSDGQDNDCDGATDSADSGCMQECVLSLLSPIDGSIFVSPTPTLDWTDASGAASYDVQICSDNNCTEIIQSVTVTESQWTVPQSSSLMLGEQYWWRVMADNPGCGSNGWTETWDFITSVATRIMDFNNGSQTGEMSIKTLDNMTELSVLDSIGMPDILWQHKIRSDIYLWFMEGIYIAGGIDMGSVTDPEWKIVSADDINKDGAPDILLQHMTQGDLVVWYMSGINTTSEEHIGIVSDPEWKIVSTDDFDGDGNLDFLWQHQIRADLYIWFMKDIEWLGGLYMGTVTDKNWDIAATADFNGDFKPDILWHHALRGDVYIWLMDGVKFLDGMHLGTVSDTNWVIAGTDDYNGDLRPDILWQNIMTGEISIWLMDNTQVLGNTDIASVYDPDWMIVAPK